MASYIPAGMDWPVQFCLFSTATTYILSLITSNVSQVDRVWTFLPTIYSAYFALLPLWPQQHQPFPLCPYTPKELSAAAGDYSSRALLMLALQVTWMFRLSYNTYRRGLFSLKDEDYRWAVLRTQLHPVLFQITNLTFIAGIQNVLLLLLGLPTYLAAIQPDTSLSPSDIGLAATALVTLALEFVADNQQYAFQTFKHGIETYDESKQWPGARLNWTTADAKRGFITRGLWAYSRHPNFACEQTFWWIITFFPFLSRSSPALPHFSLSDLRQIALSDIPSKILVPLAPLTPAFALSLLFFSSTFYTEAITLSKYPGYKAYQQRVGMFQFHHTGLKGLWLAGTGRKAEIDGLLWGSGKGKENSFKKE